MAKKRAIFVGVQHVINDRIQQLLSNLQEGWEVEMANSAVEALAAMEKDPFEVIVSENTLSDSNASELLKQVSELHPGTVRFLLSEHADRDRETVLQSAAYVHQYIDIRWAGSPW